MDVKAKQVYEKLIEMAGIHKMQAEMAMKSGDVVDAMKWAGIAAAQYRAAEIVKEELR